MLFRFNHKTSIISLLFAIALGFTFSAYVSSVSAGNYLTYPSGILTLEGIEPCKDAAECDAICDDRGASPITCFYFYGDEGLAPQKADYFKKIVSRAEKALQKLITEGKPGGSLTEEKFKKYYLEQSVAESYLRSLAEPSNSLLSKEGIRESLIQNDWPPEDVDQAFAVVDQMSEEELREASKLFSVEGIYLNNGVGIDGQYQLKNIIRFGKALEQAARKKIKPPSVCSYGLMCFGECSPDNLDLSPECKNFLTETGYADDRTIALAQLIAAKSTDDVGGGPGGCWDLVGCEIYCDAEENRDECIEFADKNDLVVEIPDDKKAVFAAMEKGESPGQCKDEASCRNYCENIDNLEECVSFVEKLNLATGDELKEIRQMVSIKKAGVSFPGNCKTKESCLEYCENSAHAVECMEFAQKAGFIPKEDAKAVGLIIPYLKSGGKLPGGCTTKESCDAYCESDAHTNECVDFAVNTGFISQEDAEIVKKTGGKGPGNCRSREACDSYCKDATHTDECIDFAVKAGFISKEDAEMAKKFGITSGPGNCKGKAECEAFCVLPENQDDCFNFAKDHGMISEEDLKNIEEQKKFLESIDKASPEWLACMDKELGSSFFERFKAGKLTQAEAKSPALETAQRKCGSEEVQEKIDACLTKSCSEFDACLKSSFPQSAGNQDQQQQSEPDPKIKAKMQACTDEKINACLAKPCSEFMTCISALGQGGEGGEQQGKPDSAISAKVQSCQPKGGDKSGGQPPSNGSQPPTQQYPDESQIQQQMQQQIQQQQQSGDQSGIPQGYSSWVDFCTANPGDSRCAPYQQQYPYQPGQPQTLLQYSPFGVILRFFLGF